ncbi:hypothetical protein HN748_02305 [Candidatus Peregrinibacteria bacterium]|nr:hypothetical protein [Candidatus Peregrinibacteria bacterium]MBT7483510.1 hypothetical protein [Candidatus Peregrinibacteria bacterium]MBT7703041.1 hypothetical protein [Candidatus Peregrinibacteria bacterium]
MEIIRNLTEAMLGSGNGMLGHFGDLFGAGVLGAVHSVMTSYYEGTLGGSSGASSGGSSSSSPDFGELFGNEFEMTPSEATTLADVWAAGNSPSEQITLSDVLGN